MTGALVHWSRQLLRITRRAFIIAAETSFFWKNEKDFWDAYPEGTKNFPILPEPEFDLDEMAIAERIINEAT